MTCVEAYDPRQPGPLLAVPMPSRIRALPRTKVGYPVPYFAALVDGEIDLRVADPVKWWACVRERLCWICGQKLRGQAAAFVIGPMGVVNGTTQEPPCHRECAEYAAKACPFLARPNMVRRTRNMPEIAHPGAAKAYNPGVAVVYITTKWRVFRPPGGAQWERLFALDVPTTVSWWREGRSASRREAADALESSMSELVEDCAAAADPDFERRVLDMQYRRALQYLPDHPHTVDEEVPV